MGQFRFVVTDKFEIDDRGTILIPGFKLEAGNRIQPGDALELKMPDGTIIKTRTTGVSLFHEDCLHVVVPIPKDEIPIGTEVRTILTTA